MRPSGTNKATAVASCRRERPNLARSLGPSSPPLQTLILMSLLSPPAMALSLPTPSPPASHPLSQCVSTIVDNTRYHQSFDFLVAEPLHFIQGHSGPAYDAKFYGEGEDCLLLSCGDDGRIRGWKWEEVLNSDLPLSMQGNHLNPVFDLVNPQHKGPWGALSPIPENNAIAVDSQAGSIFSAVGDAYAYCWDVIITGSEDGTARVWDCKSGKSVQVINPKDKSKLKEASSWVSCIAVDSSESWLACGSGRNISVWSLPACECILTINMHSLAQDVLFDDNQILAVGAEPVLTRFDINGMVLSQIQCAPQSSFSLSQHPSGVIAVGGYAGLVDVISEFGSHLCTFRCKGL